MKSAKLLLTLFVTLAIAACGKSGPDKKQNGTLMGKCSTVVLENDHLRVCYDSLINESRCMAGGLCLWQGIATGKFSFYINDGVKHTLTLATMDIDKFSRDTVIGNYKVELLDIQPYPGVNNPPPASAEVKITRL